MVPHIYNVTTGSLTVFVNGKSHVLNKDHLNYHSIKESISTITEEELENLVNVSQQITNFSNEVSVSDGCVYYQDQPLHNNMTERILTCIQEKIPSEPIIKFLENLMQNPDFRAVNELYDFLSHQGLPITDDGHFLAYKRVREDWHDYHSGKFDNHIGKTVNMPRNSVDANKDVGCSNGLHVGTLSYVKGFNSGGHIVIVKVNPRDAVSVPTHDTNKLRVCSYQVIGEIDNTDPQVLNDNYQPDDDLEDEDFDDDLENDDENDCHSDCDEDDCYGVTCSLSI